jgi:capsular polysaccharide biosynthesis protein
MNCAAWDEDKMQGGSVLAFEKPDRSQRVFEIDLRHVILDLQKKWRRVLLFCVLSAFLGLAVSRFSYVPVYTSDTTFVVSNKTVGILNESDSMTISDFNASTALANTFKYILLSDEAMQAIIDAYGLDMSVGSLKSCVNVTPVSNTNILEMSVTTPDALLSYQVASRIIAHYPDVLERTIKNASLDVLNPPQIAAAADSYHGSLIYPLIGFFLALLIAVIIIYIIQVCSDTIKTVSDIGDKLGIGVLASIPKVKSAKKKKIARSGLNILDKSNGFAFAESYKALRTKIKMTAEKKGYKTFIVTSSLENEGKTTAAVNLSIALAGSGKKVLLIDADLRKPSVYLFAGKTDLSPAHELDTVLRGSMAFAPAVVAVEKFGISALLSTGPYRTRRSCCLLPK